MRINHNITALNTYNKLSSNQAATSKSLEKLSSGLKINKAGDNAAGLAISEKMRGQIRGLDQASTNASDAISLINTAEGALSETHSILQRMRELAVQSSNDTNVTVDRSEIQKEMNQLTSEINRIGNTTEFNTQKLLDGGGASTVTKDVATVTAGGKAGKVSAMSNPTASSTGKSTASFETSTGDIVTLVGTSGNNLSGKSIAFRENAASSGAQIVLNGNTIEIWAESGASTLADIQAAIDGSAIFAGIGGATLNITTAAGVVLSGTNDLTDMTASGAAHGISLMSGATATGSNFSATGSITKGVYTFDVSQAFVTNGDHFTIELANGVNTDSKTTITLTAASGGASIATGDAAGTFKISDTAGDRYTAEEQAQEIATALKTGAWNIDNGIGAGFSAITSGYDITVNGSNIIFTEKTAMGAQAAITTGTVTSTAKASVYTYAHSTDNLVDVGGSFKIDGNEIEVVDGNGANDAENIAAGKAILKTATSGATATDQITLLKEAISRNSDLNQTYTTSGTTGSTLRLTQLTGEQSSTAATIEISDKAGQKFTASFQIGANTAQSMTVEVADMRSKALGIAGLQASGPAVSKDGTVTASYTSTKDVTDGTTNTGSEYALDVSTHEKATAAITIINDAIQTVSAERSKLGSYQNRLEHTINNLGTSSENLTSAESRIRDVDMAKEMMEFTKNNILSQAAQSMLAQANQQPQGVLQLLQ